MNTLIFPIFVCAIIEIGLLVIGTGVGYLLHLIMPRVDLGIGILIGVVATAISIFFFVKLYSLGTEGVLLDDDTADLDQAPRVPTLYAVEPMPPKGSRRPKGSRTKGRFRPRQRPDDSSS